MTTAGPSFPTAVTDDASFGSDSWSNPTNAETTNTTYATVTTLTTTHYLKATGFGFSIPSGATINGIQVAIIRKAAQSTGTKYCVDGSVKLVKGGTIGGTDKKDTSTHYLTTDATANYGTTSDLWGQAWTYSDINASNFGVAFAADGSEFTSGQVVSCDSISVTVTYTPAAGGTAGAATLIACPF